MDDFNDIHYYNSLKNRVSDYEAEIKKIKEINTKKKKQNKNKDEVLIK